jgi:LacI family transcriptional regulator
MAKSRPSPAKAPSADKPAGTSAKPAKRAAAKSASPAPKPDAPPPGCTQYEIARAAGVSQGIVSAVLRDDQRHVRFSPGMKARIEAIARSLNYRPHVGARSIRSRRTRTLGLVLSHPGNLPHVPREVYEGVVREAARLGYYLSLIHDVGREHADQPYALPRSLRELHVDGYIVFHTGLLPPELDAALRADFEHRVIFLNDDRPFNAVRPDDLAAGRLATEHALAAGYRRPVYCRTRAPATGSHYSNEHRIRGYTEVLSAVGLSPALVEGSSADLKASWDSIIQHALYSVAPEQRPDCFICGTDEMAVRTMNALLALGLRVPQDVGVIGFNDDTLGELAPRPLTTLRLDWLGMAESAVTELVRLIDDPSAPPFPAKLFQAVLNARRSTARQAPG